MSEPRRDLPFLWWLALAVAVAFLVVAIVRSDW